MLDVGCNYKIVTLETGDNYEGKWATYESSRTWEVAAVEGTLVKLLGPDYSDPRFSDFMPEGSDPATPREEVIINMASLFFVRAEKDHKVQ